MAGVVPTQMVEQLADGWQAMMKAHITTRPAECRILSIGFEELRSG